MTTEDTTPKPPTEWEMTKRRWAAQQAMLLAAWGMKEVAR